MIKKRKISISVISMLLIISIGNYLRLSSGNIRTVEFISILAIGALAGLLISQIVAVIKK